MTESDYLIADVVHKQKKAMGKFNSFQKAFAKLHNEKQADLDKARRIWNEVGKQFKWWGRLP